MESTTLDAMFAGLALRGYIGDAYRPGKGHQVAVDFLVPSRELAEIAVEHFGAGRVVERGNKRIAYRVQGRAALPVIERLAPHLVGPYRGQANNIINNASSRKDIA